MAGFEKVAEISDLKPGECKVVQAGGHEVGLFNVGGRYYAIDNTCKHRGGPLGEGVLEGNIVTCPWHGWKYDVTTGKATTAPAEVAVYEVKLEGTAVMIKVP